MLDSLKEDEKDPSSPSAFLDYLHDHRLPGSVDIRPPRGILQVRTFVFLIQIGFVNVIRYRCYFMK